MPPKKKSGPPPAPIEDQITHTRAELRKLKKERNHAQLARDRSLERWQQAKAAISKDTLMTKEALQEDAELKHRVVIAEYEAAIERLNADHQAALDAERRRCAETAGALRSEYDELERQLRQCIADLKQERREQHLACEALERELGRQHDEEKAELGRRYDGLVRATDDEYREKERMRERTQDLRRRREVRWQEERFNYRISLMLGEFREIRDQYNIVKHQTVHQLKEQVDTLRCVARQLEAKMSEVVEQNKGFTAELRQLQATADYEDSLFQQQVRNYEGEMAKMATLRARIRASARQAERIEASHGQLLQAYDVTKAEKDELERKYALAAQEMQKVLCLRSSSGSSSSSSSGKGSKTPAKMGTGTGGSSGVPSSPSLVSPPTGRVQMIGEV